MLDSIISAGSSLLGGLFGDSDAKKNRQMQMDLAKNQIKYRVEDAKQSGIHPLYALGASPQSFTPVSSPLGDSVSRAGSQIAGGVSNSYERKLQELNLQNVQADIDLKKSQSLGYIADAKRASNLAMASQGNSKIMSKYVKVSNPFTGKTEWMPNPDLGVEYPDTYGTSLLLNATAQDIHGQNKSKVRKVHPSVRKNSNPRAYKRNRNW